MSGSDVRRQIQFSNQAFLMFSSKLQYVKEDYSSQDTFADPAKSARQGMSTFLPGRPAKLVCHRRGTACQVGL